MEFTVTTTLSRAPHGVGPWKHICKLWDEFNQDTYLVPGSGAHIKLWEEKWLGNSMLKENYPSLYQISCDPTSTIFLYRENNAWSILFRRNLHDWEFEDLLSLLSRLETCQVNAQNVDQLKWGSSKEGNYSVKAGYSSLVSQNVILQSWPWKLIWRTNYPLKSSVFVGLHYGKHASHMRT